MEAQRVGARDEARANLNSWSESTLAIEHAAGAMALAEQAAAKERTRLHFEEVRAAAEAKAAERAAEAAARRIPQHVADAGLLGQLGRNLRRAPHGTRA